MNHKIVFSIRVLACVLSIELFFSLAHSAVIAAPQSPEGAGDYSFTATSGSYEEISAGTLSTATGDDGAENIELPFLFYFDSLVYSNARISVNGWLEMGQFYTGEGYVNNLADLETRPLLAPFWDDLYDDAASEVRYQTLGSSPDRVFIVQWKEVRWAGSSGTRQNFQVRLYEGSNRIEFIYGTMNNSTNTSASIGLIDPVGGGDHFLSITPGSPPATSSSAADNNITNVNYLVSGTTYVFSPPCLNLWSGSIDHDWQKSGNWNCAAPPGEEDNATIPAGTPNEPILGSNTNLAILGIQPGAALSLNGGDLAVKGLRIYGELAVVSDETITVSGTTAAWDRDPGGGVFQKGSGLVIFSGGGTLTTRAAETFYNLRINSGKSFDPASNPLRIDGSFTNQGTFWPSTDNSQGNFFNGPVVNESLWRQRIASLQFNNSFMNMNDATFYASSDSVVGTVFNSNMTNSGTFNASDGGKLVVKGDWTNLGLFTPGSGKIIFGGTDIQNIQDSGGINQFYNMLVSGGSKVVLQNNLNLQSDLYIDPGGEVDLDENALTLSGALINQGTLIQTKDVPGGTDTEFLKIQNSPGTVDAYRGVIIHPESSLGSTRVAIRGQQENGCTNDPSVEQIARCFSISPQTSSAATVRFYYQENELNGQNYNDLKLWHYLSGWSLEGVNYSYSSSCSSEQIDCWLQAEQVSSYSPFILGSGGTPTVVGEMGFQVASRSVSLLSVFLLLCVGSGLIILFYVKSRPRMKS